MALIVWIHPTRGTVDAVEDLAGHDVAGVREDNVHIRAGVHHARRGARACVRNACLQRGDASGQNQYNQRRRRIRHSKHIRVYTCTRVGRGDTVEWINSPSRTSVDSGEPFFTAIDIADPGARGRRAAARLRIRFVPRVRGETIYICASRMQGVILCAGARAARPSTHQGCVLLSGV